ncbi:MAG TPA: hypothetical protein VGP46_05210, partial [Acidimicrobiales bacterium]|nr:hypothetical protein [Acidimicrobiales bacterium]
MSSGAQGGPNATLENCRHSTCAAAAALALAACGSSPSGSGSRPTTTSTGGSSPIGGTAYWAEPPDVKPNWIFPFEGLTYFSTVNGALQSPLYRPLYWFGPPGTAAPTVDFSLSPADQPVFSDNDTKITVTLKGWKFDDGQTVDAQSVIFWMNMLKVEGANDWGGYVPGSNQFPGNVKSYEASSATASVVTFTLDSSYNPTWFLYNELSQITPMSEVWDITSLTGAPASGGCGAVLPGVQMTGAETAIVRACTK